MSISPEKQGLFQVIYNVVNLGDNQDLTISKKIHWILAKHLKKIFQVEKTSRQLNRRQSKHLVLKCIWLNK